MGGGKRRLSLMHKHLLMRSIGYADMARHAATLRRACDDIVRDNARRHLAARMGRLRGLPQKVGQILSMSADGAAGAFDGLCEQAEPVPLEAVLSELESAWGFDPRCVIEHIEPDGRAASLGQVHKARLLDGREVAIKVRFPGIRQAVENDLRLLGWLSAPVGDLRRGFNLEDYRREILSNVGKELDYRIEAENQRRYKTLLSEIPGWDVPSVIGEHSTETVLVTEWVEGDPLDVVLNRPRGRRDELARTLLRGFFHMLFRHGLLHADPHPGNYRFRADVAAGQVVLFDFGCVTRIRHERRLALLKLIEMTQAGRGDPYPALVALGFDATMLEPVRPVLAALCRVLFEPFCTPGNYDLSGWRRAERAADVLGDHRWNFRMAGPAELIFVMRAFHGLTYYLERLGAQVCWSHALQPYLDAESQRLAALTTPPAPTPGAFEAVARHLRIAVTEGPRTRVALTFPAMAVERLPDLMDGDLLAKLRSRQIDLDAIVSRARSAAYAPQTLFELSEGDSQKSIRVWLD